MSDLEKKQGVWFIYDGECPLCHSAAHALRIRQKYGSLHLINAREEKENPIVKEVTRRGYDLDAGMIIFYENRFFHGKEALKFMAGHGAAKNAFTLFCKSLFWSKTIAFITYPWMRGTRNWLLKRKNGGRIDNLGLKQAPIFQSVFGDDWHKLPPILKKHYQNRPYSDDETHVEGTLDLYCAPHIKAFAPFLWLLKTIPPVTEKNVPVTVHFNSAQQTREFQFNRLFYFKNKRPYAFQSKMLPVKGNEVVEIMKAGFCWKMHYLWQDDKVVLRHQGYALKAFGHLIPLPITFLIGRGDAEEWAISDTVFEMDMHITHPWFGKIYGYKGRFEIK